jgi:hypothetical protein
MMAEAEKTIARPTTTSVRVVKKIHLSTPMRLAIFFLRFANPVIGLNSRFP